MPNQLTDPDPAPARFRVLYVSGNPNTCGHVYRIVHYAAALQASGIAASWTSLANVTTADIAAADIVVIWRAPWDEAVARVHEECRARHLPVGVDFDDMIFDPEWMNADNSDYLQRTDARTRQHWLEHVIPGCARTLAASDFALVSTEPLARAAEARGTRAYVLPNGLDAGMIAAADAALADPDLHPVNGEVRLGYASGTPTHQKDFAVVAPVLASLLETCPELMLSIVGSLVMDDFGVLLPHRDRIEVRPLVPFVERFKEYARFDLNIAPLQGDLPFCQGKSELKYFEPALVLVPTVATATPPFANAIRPDTGFCARTEDEWRTSLQRLIHNPAGRRRMGVAARAHAIATFGPEAQRDAARRVFAAITARGEQ